MRLATGPAGESARMIAEARLEVALGARAAIGAGVRSLGLCAHRSVSALQGTLVDVGLPAKGER